MRASDNLGIKKKSRSRDQFVNPVYSFLAFFMRNGFLILAAGVGFLFVLLDLSSPRSANAYACAPSPSRAWIMIIDN